MIIALVVASARASAAGDPAGDGDRVSAARQAFLDGAALAREARWAEALQAFERSASLRPGAGTTYDIAYCERALGHWTRAYSAFQRALVENENEAEGKRELSDSLVQETKEYLHDVETRTAISIDGRPLEAMDATNATSPMIAGTSAPSAGRPAPAGPFHLWIDPGIHNFILVSEQGSETVLTISVREGDTANLQLEAKPPASNPVVAVASSRPLMPKGRKRAAYVSLGIAGLGVAVGSFAGVTALIKRSDLGTLCLNGHCPPEQRANYNTMLHWADASTVAFSIGLAAAVTGAVLFEWPRGTSVESRSASTDVRREIVVAPWGPLGMSVSATY